MNFVMLIAAGGLRELLPLATLAIYGGVAALLLIIKDNGWRFTVKSLLTLVTLVGLLLALLTSGFRIQ
jgi:hypothetical protein